MVDQVQLTIAIFAETDESSLSIEKIIDLQQLSLREFYNKSIKL